MYVHPYNGIFLINKKEQTIDTSLNSNKSKMHYAKWKKPDPKYYMLWHIYITHMQ